MAKGLDFSKHPNRWSEEEIVELYKRLIRQGHKQQDAEKRATGLLLQMLHLRLRLIREMSKERLGDEFPRHFGVV